MSNEMKYYHFKDMNEFLEAIDVWEKYSEKWFGLNGPTQLKKYITKLQNKYELEKDRYELEKENNEKFQQELNDIAKLLKLNDNSTIYDIYDAIATLRRELNNQYVEITKLQQENQKLSESYGKSVSKQYLERIDTLNKRIEELNNDKNRFKEERDNVIKEKENIATEMSELKRKYELTNENWNNQNQVMENMQTQINVSHKVNEELRDKIEQLQKEIKEKDIEIETYKNAIQNISVNFNGTIKSTSKKVSKSKGE